MARECAKPVQGYFREDRDNPGEDKWVDLSTAFSCSVQIPDGEDTHDGPHAAREAAQTGVARERWLKKNSAKQESLRHAQSGLGQFQGPAVTFAQGHAEEGSMMPHPSATVRCPFNCGEDPMYKDLSRHLIEHQGREMARQQGGSAPAPKPKKGNPYMAPDVHDLQVGPPAAWIRPTGAGAPGWNIAIPDNRQIGGEREPQTQEAFIPSFWVPNADELGVFEGDLNKVLPTRANREGDQQLPVVNERVSIQDQVIAEIEDRKKIGLERYNSLLQADNGRDALRDAKEEALDLLMYLKQYEEERNIYAAEFAKVKAYISRIQGYNIDEETIEAIRRLEAWLR